MKNPIPPGKDSASTGSQGKSTSNRAFDDNREVLKSRGISNSGGQMSDQTDNKQATVNKGNVNPDVQGKQHAPQKPSESSPKKK
ncbi:hypothetical protein [Daejeonella oryzae]|uniref:hypothetical protein n=1 Tax=Daejeonella oryzae TaxID=1122943 RepID=UPI000413772E|nr:hypothetical protein [Daejeonella oryzae]